MTKMVYLWFTGEDSNEFVSETIEAGEREFAKKYPDFSIDYEPTHRYRYTTERGEVVFCWVTEIEFIPEQVLKMNTGLKESTNIDI